MKRAIASLMVATALPLLAQESATLSAPSEVVIGSQVEVHWTAPGTNYDSIYVIAPDADDSASGIHSVSILNGRNPVLLTMPESPGAYQLRYWSREQSKVLARRSIEVVDIPTELSAPSSALMGSSLEVHWQGPGNQYDPIGLYPVGAADDAKAVASAGIVSGRNPVVLHLPETPGQYELRYLTRATGRVLARRPLMIEGMDASLVAEDEAEMGAAIEVRWTGPGNQYDRIEVHSDGAADSAKALAQEAIISRRNPILLHLPEVPGNYELRYVTARSGTVLARRALKIGGVSSSLRAADTATASTPFAVNWEGPGNDYDRIELFRADAGDTEKALAVATILNGRNPVLLNLPDENGAFELRYVTARSAQVLAQRPLQIQPAGRLSVVFQGETHGSGGGSGAVELILDASGSMLQRQDGERRIDIAKSVLTEIVESYLDESTHFALRVFGHKEADTCRTDLEIPLSPLDRGHVTSRIGAINAMNLAKTPIADSLALVPGDLAAASGPKSVILVTDGEETCEGDPASVISNLRQQGLDIQLSIVGFAIDDAELIREFESWSQLGGGSYFNAGSADELMQSLRRVISGPFQVFDGSGTLVASGIIGGKAVVLPAGQYRIERPGAPPLVIDAVEIRPDETTEVSF